MAHTRRPRLQEATILAAALFTTLVLLPWGASGSGDEQGPTTRDGRSCQGRRIFREDLPSKFNLDLVYNEEEAAHIQYQWFTDYMLTHLKVASSNMGFGPGISNPVPQATGLDGQWFLTDQNSLDLIFYRRMLNYPCMVSSHEEADLIYVPYFGGFDILRNMHEKEEKRDALGKELLAIVRAHPAWQRKNGSDHFMVLGRNLWDFTRMPGGNWGSILLRQEGFLDNVWATVVETAFWEHRVMSIPKPTAFHPQTLEQVKKWQDFVRSQDRKKLFAFAGAARDRRTQEGRLRANLLWQCKNSQSCSMVSCEYVDKATGAKCDRISSFFELYLGSRFCLHPIGDACTRRSVLDGMLAGCIPVVFKGCTLEDQFKWHFPPDVGHFYVFIPIDEVKGPFAPDAPAVVEDVLKAIPEEEVEQMRKRVIELIPKFVYGGTLKNGTIEAPDFQDSIDLMIEGIATHQEKVPVRAK